MICIETVSFEGSECGPQDASAIIAPTAAIPFIASS